MEEIKLTMNYDNRWISKEEHDRFIQEGKALCQRVKNVDFHCSNKDHYGLEEYKICQECQLEKDITIRQGNVIIQLWNTEESRWLNKGRHNLVGSFFPNKICKRTRYIKGRVEYCSNIVSPKGKNICIICLTEHCEALNCINKADIITVDYQLCNHCYSKDSLGINKGDINPFLWSNMQDRWIKAEILDIVKLLFDNVCSSVKRIDSETIFCPNIIKNPSRSKCDSCISEDKKKICQGLNCSNEIIFSSYDYSVCQECSLKKNLVIFKNGYRVSIWINNDSRWLSNMEYWDGLGTINYCKNSKFIDGVENYCSNLKPPNKDRCYACEETSSESVKIL